MNVCNNFVKAYQDDGNNEAECGNCEFLGFYDHVVSCGCEECEEYINGVGGYDNVPIFFCRITKYEIIPEMKV